MYANNVLSKRRPDGWAERRRHFERLIDQWRVDEDERASDTDSSSTDRDDQS